MRAFEVEQRVDLDRDGVVSAKHAGLMAREASRVPEGRAARGAAQAERAAPQLRAARLCSRLIDLLRFSLPRVS